MNDLYTIGHSTHSIERFIELIQRHHIDAVCDVRSSPYSRYNPQFNRETLQAELKRHGIAYVFLGKELGPRSDDPGCYENGKVQYDRLAQMKLFQEGLRRVRQGMASYRVALMCSEKDPATCHRTILVCRRLRDKDTRIRHILEDGSVEENDLTIRRLKNLLKLPEIDLFTSPEEMVERAYDIQGDRIAYVQENDKTSQERGRET
ncbi:MAG: hypothetical protein QG552_3890 [Thermodesulfobacteriota bacterium]|nr:hypothetical protein [Thermodesulfobacteriota bacterium]